MFVWFIQITYFGRQSFCCSAEYLPELSTNCLCIYIVYVWFVLFCNVWFRVNKLNIRTCESWFMKSMQIPAICGRFKLHVLMRAQQQHIHLCKCLFFYSKHIFQMTFANAWFMCLAGVDSLVALQIGRLATWLAGWLVGWLICWSGWLIGWLTGWFVGWLAGAG